MVEIWIGSEKADYDGDIECQYSVTDFRELLSGNLNTSYSIDLPNTPKNQRLLKYVSTISNIEEQTAISRIIINDIEIIKGGLKILSTTDNFTKIIIRADNWIDVYKSRTLLELDFSAYDKEFTSANVVASWTAASGEFIRFPLVSYGKSDHDGNTIMASDFAPFFNVQKIIEKIFYPNTIVSNFFSSTYFKSLYISSNEPKYDDSAIEGREMDVKVNSGTDNLESYSLLPSETTNVELDIAKIKFLNEIKDDEYAFTVDEYEVVREGTYRLKFFARPTWDIGVSTYNSGSWGYDLIKIPLVGANITMASATGSGLPPDLDFDTGYIHVLAGEKFFCKMYVVMNLTNPFLDPIDINISADVDTQLYSKVDRRCLLPGIGRTIEYEKWMHDWTQEDFIKSLKTLFNLVIWKDLYNNVVYVEPAQTFFTSNVKDISNSIDYSSIDIELISNSLNKYITLKYKEDESDISLTEYNANNTISRGEKTITLTSEYVKNGTYSYETKFSTFNVGFSKGFVAPDIPTIWMEYDKLVYGLPQERLAGYNMKIGEWKGYNAGASWDYEGVTKTSFPELDNIDFASIYITYFGKTLHLIDRGKLITLNGISVLSEIQELVTVINSAEYEGFRVLYKFWYEGEYHYGYLNRKSTNGIRTKHELTLII